jgi:hypothetical protein
VVEIFDLFNLYGFVGSLRLACSTCSSAAISFSNLVLMVNNLCGSDRVRRKTV